MNDSPRENAMAEAESTLSEMAEPVVPDQFVVNDAATANWVVRRIVQARQYRDKVEAWAAGEMRRAEREEAFFLGRFSQQLQAWVKAELGSQPRRKSINLPAGTIGYRTEATKLLIENDDRLLQWCRSNLENAVKTEHRVLRSRVMEHVAATGEVPDGTELGGGGEKFYVR